METYWNTLYVMSKEAWHVLFSKSFVAFKLNSSFRLLNFFWVQCSIGWWWCCVLVVFLNFFFKLQSKDVNQEGSSRQQQRDKHCKWLQSNFSHARKTALKRSIIKIKWGVLLEDKKVYSCFWRFFWFPWRIAKMPPALTMPAGTIPSGEIVPKYLC